MFLLDTAAISEIDSPTPNPGMISWLTSVEWIDLYLSVISVAEIWQGIARLPEGKKRRAFEASFHMIRDRFPGRILDVNFAVAAQHGEIQARIGPLPVMDTLIGATALVNHLMVVTRNTSDIGRTGARIHDPWV
jgi:predicted nucleic acid-binding protein